MNSLMLFVNVEVKEKKGISYPEIPLVDKIILIEEVVDSVFRNRNYGKIRLGDLERHLHC